MNNTQTYTTRAYTIYTPHQGIVSKFIFAFAFLGASAVLLAGIYFVAQLLNLVMETIVETSHHIAALYASSDHYVQLILLLVISYCVVRVVRSAYRSLVK